MGLTIGVKTTGSGRENTVYPVGSRADVASILRTVDPSKESITVKFGGELETRTFKIETPAVGPATIRELRKGTRPLLIEQ